MCVLCGVFLKVSEPLQQFVHVGVVAELFEGGDLRAHGNDLAEDLHLARAVLDLAAARAHRLEADEQDEVARVRQALDQVVLDAAALAHSVGGDDDRREVALVDLLGLLRRCWQSGSPAT